MIRKLIFCLLALSVLQSCAETEKGKAVGQQRDRRDFPVLQIPAMYTSDEEREKYAVEHYWDRFFNTDQLYPNDSTTLNGVAIEEVEQQYATFLTIISNVDIGQAYKGIDKLFSKLEAMQEADTSSTVFSSFESMTKKYLFDPNSPYRNEDLYGRYISHIISSPYADTLLIPAYTNDVRLCSLNSTGSRAADFVFEDIKGKRYSLYGIDADYTLLFFSNPGCEACKSIIEILRNNPMVSTLIEGKHLAVINVYIDEDIEAWKGYQDYYPDNWYNGYDPSYTIRQSLSYNVRAIPSLYLLADDKTVILKDCPEEKLFTHLDRIAAAYL